MLCALCDHQVSLTRGGWAEHGALEGDQGPRDLQRSLAFLGSVSLQAVSWWVRANLTDLRRRGMHAYLCSLEFN